MHWILLQVIRRPAILCTLSISTNYFSNTSLRKFPQSSNWNSTSGEGKVGFVDLVDEYITLGCIWKTNFRGLDFLNGSYMLFACRIRKCNSFRSVRSSFCVISILRKHIIENYNIPWISIFFTNQIYIGRNVQTIY